MTIPTFLRLTGLIFKELGAQVIETPSGLEGMGKLFTHRPDLIILDAMMSGIDGFQICQRIRQFSNTPLIMLSALDQDQLMLQGLEAGADDFLSKPVNPEILLARARAVMRRSDQTTNHQVALNYNDGRLEINVEKHRVQVRGKEVKLTPFEFRLLAFLAGNEGRVVSYEQILLMSGEGSIKASTVMYMFTFRTYAARSNRTLGIRATFVPSMGWDIFSIRQSQAIIL